VTDLVCRKKWNKIKKSSLSSKFKGTSRDLQLSNNNLLKSSTDIELPSAGLYLCRLSILHSNRYFFHGLNILAFVVIIFIIGAL